MAKNVHRVGFQAGAGGFVARDNDGVGEFSLDDTNFVTATELNALDGLTASTRHLSTSMSDREAHQTTFQLEHAWTFTVGVRRQL